MARDNDPEKDEFASFEAEARTYAAGKNRERTGEIRMATTRSVRAGLERPDNPLKAHDRHREENATGQEKRLRSIADPERRDNARTEVEKHYTAWARALKKAHTQRYDISDRIYERKLSETKIDQRLIPKNKKEDIRKESIREAVAQSNNRIQEINVAIPKMIDKTISDAVKLPRQAKLDKDTQRAKDLASDYKARAAKADRDRAGKEFER
jgi:hypothetical protein